MSQMCPLYIRDCGALLVVYIVKQYFKNYIVLACITPILLQPLTELTRQNKSDWPGPQAIYLNKISLVLSLQMKVRGVGGGIHTNTYNLKRMTHFLRINTGPRRRSRGLPGCARSWSWRFRRRRRRRRRQSRRRKRRRTRARAKAKARSLKISTSSPKATRTLKATRDQSYKTFYVLNLWVFKFSHCDFSQLGFSHQGFRDRIHNTSFSL